MQKLLASHKIDALLVQSPVNNFYFTHYPASYAYVVITENGRSMYTDPRYYEEAKAFLTDTVVVSVKGAEALAVIAKNLHSAGVKNLGYEDDYLTVAQFKAFKKAFEGFTLKPASSLIHALRLIKTPAQIAAIAAAQHLTEQVFEEVCDGLKPGVTEREVRARLIIEALEAGADGAAFEPIVAFGENTAIPHHRASERRLEKEDIILIDFGVKLDGYCSDMTRTFCLNEPDDEKLAHLHEIVLGAQSYVLKHLKAGMTSREADSLAREYIRANGYDAEFSHALGHGIGLEIHESPKICEENQDILLPGMVVTVEPGIYVSGVGGVRIEDTVVIREEGIENLTKAKKEFIL
ncbi:MAG: Xaa-Pro peptidase family protein [Firmicutes bacterium]|nr:Xaa-Pro peptidase family protein [Bacillota bacterium]